MKIAPIEIASSGPGVDLSNLPNGLSVKMADPDRTFTGARNAVTLTYDLSGYTQVRLRFEAKEYGDEPHAPPSNPFTGEVNFDGVAVSADGATWCEIQDLRHLRSDRFTAFDIDLDAAVALWGLSYGSEFQIRFCQYDNNPGPMDGIFLYAIELSGEPGAVGAPVFHLPMDDNAANPTVHDIAASGRDQVFIDPAGDPNTAAHSVPGPNGTLALAFDGVDDRIDFGPTLLGDIVGQGQDFTIAFWFRTESDPGSSAKTFFCRGNTPVAEPHLRFYMGLDDIFLRAGWGGVDQYVTLRTSGGGMLDGQWHHLIYRRQGQTLSLWVDGTTRQTRSDPNYASSFYCETWLASAIGQIYQSSDSDWPFEMADFRVYDRALSDEEIETLSQ